MALAWKAAAKDLRRSLRAPSFRVVFRAYSRKSGRYDRLRQRMDQPKDPTPETFLKATSNVDAWLRMAGLSSEAELEQLLMGNLNAHVVLEHEFERRFPSAHNRWLRRLESDGRDDV